MDSTEVHTLLSEVSTFARNVTSRSDRELLIEQSDVIGDILMLLDEGEHDLIAEQMLERFWRLVLRWYFFPFDNKRQPFVSTTDELYQRAGMLISVLRLYGDLYGFGLEPEARAICMAIKKSCREFLKSPGPLRATQALVPATDKSGLRLVVNN